MELYGLPEDAYSTEDEMYRLVHEMRTRLITSPSFNGDQIIGAILFERTMGSYIEGRGSADYLWSEKRVVPFLKVDQGLAHEANGVQLMKLIPGLDSLLTRAIEKGMFGTKMRSFFKLADDAGIRAVVDQQFEIGRRILTPPMPDAEGVPRLEGRRSDPALGVGPPPRRGRGCRSVRCAFSDVQPGRAGGSR